MEERSYTRKELQEIADSCYSNRWNVGKDYFAGLDAMIDVLYLMEQKGVKTVQEALEGMNRDGEDYPL